MYILFPRLRLRVSIFAIPSLILMLWLEGAIPFAVMLLSAAVHEFGHLAALRFLKYRPRRIDILPMGALIVVPEGIPDRDEVVIAVAGPLASLLAAFAASAVFALNGNAVALFAVLINLTLGIFNLLPVRKLDGGKALCCLVAHKKSGELVCRAASAGAKIIFVAVAVLCVVSSEFNLGVIVLSSVLLLQLM